MSLWYYFAPLTCFMSLYLQVSEVDYIYLPLFILAHLFTALGVFMCHQLDKVVYIFIIIVFNQTAYLTGGLMENYSNSVIWTYLMGWLGQLMIVVLFLVSYMLITLLVYSFKQKDEVEVEV